MAQDRGREGSSETAQQLAEFYRGRTVLITGAAGFIGKVFLYRVMQSLPECGKIFVLLRAKRELSPQQRFNRMIARRPFVDPEDPSRSLRCDWAKAIEVIDGDMSKKRLGLSEAAAQRVTESVEIVFNCAASVSFDAPLKDNLKANYLGARNLLELALEFKRLVSFVHVSTFYTNSHHPHIEERIVPMDRDCEKTAELIQWMPEALCAQVESRLLEQRPNTYIFTKALTENLVSKFADRLPLAVLRPSIVTPSFKDPHPGWLDNLNGPMGLGLLASMGILRNIDWNYWGVADMVPVDVVANAMLAVAERTVRKFQKSEVKVYNCSSSSLNPQTWGGTFEVLRAESIKAPPMKMLRVPIHPPKHRRANRFEFQLTKLSELIFAYLIDLLLLVCGQKQMLVRLTKRLHKGYEVLLPFTTTEYTCDNGNLTACLNELQPNDRATFSFDIANVDMYAAAKSGYYVLRKNILKEDLANIPAARMKLRVMIVTEFCLKLLVYLFLGWAATRALVPHLRSIPPVFA